MTSSFGKLPDGRAAHLHVLTSPSGFRAEISDYGATVVRLFAPDRRGEFADVVLGFDSVEDYVAHSPYFGGIIGRVGNRIAHGAFTLDGHTYQLAKNNTPGGRPCHLHGGVRGYDKVLWDAARSDGAEGAALTLRYLSVDGEEGYPGNLEVTVVYTVTANHSLRIDYTATTDRPTPVNLTNHSYFNLAGEGCGSILGHELTIAATHFTPVDAGLIPTGEIAPVAGTPLDFTEPRAIGGRIDQPEDQLRFGGGYDHNFVLAPRARATPTLAARLSERASGRVLEVHTTEPGLQFYSGNFLAGAFAAKQGHVYHHRDGLCLETQHFPDSPNQPAFPPVILRPGATLRSTTIYRFSTQ